MRQPFVVCKASAGSGKTFRLVVEYLKMAFDGPRDGLADRMRGILAITFTNKAAQEMKTRIMSELSAMARPSASGELEGMGAILLAELRETPYYARRGLSEEELRAMAGELQSVVLHHYSDFSVSTIDSFMHRIVRTFAHDLGLPMRFDVVLDKEEMIDEVVERLMQQVGTEGNEDLTGLILAYAESQMRDAKSYRVERPVKELASELFSEGGVRHLERLSKMKLSDYMRLHKQMRAECDRVAAKMQQVGQEAMGLLRAEGVAPEDCYQTNKGFWGYFGRLAEGTVAKPGAYTETAFGTGKLWSGKPSPEGKAALERLAPQLEALYNQACEVLDREWDGYSARQLLLSNLYATALLNRLDEEKAAYQAENEVVHLAEFNRRIYDKVSAEPAPFIFERLGSRYRHFLIDEFQDTSVMQWHNLVPLIDNGVSQGQESLVVGDGKQAIYRFRQGDVRQFVRLPEVEGLEHPVNWKDMSKTLMLSQNRRSGRAIVEFNNRFFSWLARERYAHNDMVRDIYVGAGQDLSGPPEADELRQQPVKQLEGYVEAVFVDEGVGDEYYGQVLSIIEDLHDRKGFAYKEIMIVARWNKELAAASRYLSEHSEVPLTSSESFLLTSSHAAMAVVAALRCLADRADRVAVAELIFRLQMLGLVEAQSEQALIGQREEVDLAALLRRLNPALDFRPEYLGQLSLYDCCEEVVRELRLDGLEVSFVASLLNRVSHFSTHHHKGIADFLDWFDQQKNLSVAGSDSLDAVGLMTIHKAKGLESNVVICLLSESRQKGINMWVELEQAENEENPQLPSAYISTSRKCDAPRFADAVQQEAAQCEVDELNVLYVALTRPREQLYIVSPTPKTPKSKKEPSLHFSALLYDFMDSQGGVSSMGSPEHKPSTEAATPGPEKAQIQGLSYGRWSERVSVASPAEKALDRLADSKVRFGLLAHDLLSGIRQAADVQQAVSNFVGRENLTEEEREQLEQLAMSVVQHPDSEVFFRSENEVKMECRMVSGGKELRPDRVVVSPKGTYVVDFKTGQPLGSHHEQVRQYCQVIASMGYPEVHGCLLYLLPELKRVDVC